MKQSNNFITKSTITCPNCGNKQEEEMPTDACQFFINVKIVPLYYNPRQEIVVCIAAMAQ